MERKPVKKPYAKPLLIEYGSLNAVIRTSATSAGKPDTAKDAMTYVS